MMADGGGPCRCSLSACASTLSSGNLWTSSRASCKVRAKERGLQVSPWQTSLWEERGDVPEGDP
jgi:hypothetical protein